MWQLTKEHYYRVPEWTKFPWLEHGFGTSDVQASPDRLATVQQVHGKDVFVASEPGPRGTADGLVSSVAGLKVGVKTADCLPVLLVDPERRVVAAVHAGWRGTAAGIVAAAIKLMKERFGTDAGKVEAAIGPGIGKCCFEVGPEVAREFGPWESELKTCLDLSQINRERLEAEGVSKIYESGLCTMCGLGFHSYRRDKEKAGRMISYVGLKDGD